MFNSIINTKFIDNSIWTDDISVNSIIIVRMISHFLTADIIVDYVVKYFVIIVVIFIYLQI